MPFFRSARMWRCEIVLHIESAFDCVVEMGFLGMVQFIENPAKSRRFLVEEKRCAEVWPIIERLEEGVDKCKLKIAFNPNADVEEIPLRRDLEELEETLLQIDSAYNEVEDQYNQLYDEYDRLMETYHVLESASKFLEDIRSVRGMAWSDSIIRNLMRDDISPPQETDHFGLRYYVGSIPCERFPAFELMLWRLCHSNCMIKHSEIPLSPENEKSPHPIRKYAFIVFFIGDHLSSKIKKTCQGFQVRLIECSESSEERMRTKHEIAQRLLDMEQVFDETKRQRCSIMKEAAPNLYVWRIKCRKMLMVFQALNEFTTVPDMSTTNYMKIEAWIPADKAEKVRATLWRGVRRATRGDPALSFPPMLNILPIPPRTKAPTYFKLNRFTRGFQNLIDVYGIPTYRELNPGPYTIITFPFLFSVMFGDIGHGLIMTLFAIWLVLNEKKLERQRLASENSSEIFDLLFAGRYVILLMGIFSVYAGFIYNDIFSKAINLFGSKWRVNFYEPNLVDEKEVVLDPATKDYVGTPYWLGVDPIWRLSNNGIKFENSMKMKLAVILGVTHMMFGYALEARDNLYSEDYVQLVLVTTPSIVFFMSLFVYLAYLIFLKWAWYGGHSGTPYDSSCAPALLVKFINMLLLRTPPESHECLTYMFDFQPGVEFLSLLLAFVAVIVLLIGKPLYITRKQRPVKEKKFSVAKQRARARSVFRLNMGSQASHGLLIKSEKIVKESKLEMWISSGLHCIETCLGAVSHTASYLRLWALSLAHGELSAVLWNMVLLNGLNKGRGFVDSVVLFMVFAMWSCLTVAILCVMEGLSAFLHTLRLHWVEFQSKFYEGDGTAFAPFCFGKTKARQKVKRETKQP